MKTTLLVAAALALVALSFSQCSSCPPSNADCNTGLGGSDTGGGSGGGGTAGSRYTIVTLDSTASDPLYIDMAVDPNPNSTRVGVAYFVGQGANPDGSIDTPFYHLKYVEWKDGVVGTPEDIVPAVKPGGIQRFIGVSIAYDPTTSEPSIAYLGGGADMSLYWFNSDAELATRNAGTWTQQAVATNGAMITCGNPVSDTALGIVVGVWSTIKYDSTGTAYFCYRDVHTGQYPQGDWAGSDLECWHGPHATGWVGECTKAGGNEKDAPGGHIAMTMVNDQPVIVYDHELGGADTLGNNPFLVSRTSAPSNVGTPAPNWTNPSAIISIANSGDGSSLAYDPMVGLGVAVNDVNTGILYYTTKSLVSNQWNTAAQVYGAGTGGLFPSLAYDPNFHEPVIAYFDCSLNPGVSDYGTHCQPDHQELRIDQLNSQSGKWNHDVVDTVTARRLRLGFLPSGKRVLAYRVVQTGELKLAIEK